MTFTYETPPATPRDEVRFWSTDTVERPYSVTDEEIEYLLQEYDGNVKLVASVVADRIADYWSTEKSAVGGNKKVGPFDVGQRDGTDLASAWRARAARLRAGSPSGIPIFTGGDLFTGDAEPEFGVGMMDNGHQAYPPRQRRGVPENGVW